jgi:putative membrane-bound dehydrogenase-like protein
MRNFAMSEKLSGSMLILGCLIFSLLCRADEFPELRNTDPGNAVPMPAAESAKSMQLPKGFEAKLFAAEPDVQNPIAMAWDRKGRLWIAENFTYAERTQRFDLSLRDRVLIFEDQDGDGKAETRKVFSDQVQMLTSVEVGHGGVWLMCPPQLLFMPDRDQNDIPDGPVEVVLDGFEVAQDNYHNFANGLKWGPDGWLYGRCGHSCPGRIGVPGTAAAERVPLEGGIWRFHPQKKTFEVLCHGTVNPWGHDWDRHGELFFINTVIGHLWHMLPGSHFKESFGESINPNVFERMDMIADHYHYDTKSRWMDSRDGKANSLGGGHAHVGMMIYLESKWPEAYRNRLMTINMHGLRVNVERLERTVSGYVGKHEPDFMISKDPFFRGTDLSVGPDGDVYVIDWSDIGECHEHTGVHRTSGRIFKIEYTGGEAANAAGQTAKNAKGFITPRCWAGEGILPDLWQRYTAGKVSQDELLALTTSSDEHVRVWAIRLLTDHWPLDWITGPNPGAVYPADPKVIEALERMAQSDPSGLVARVLLSSMQRLPWEFRARIAKPIISREELGNDRDLALLAWYGLIPVGQKQPESLLQLATISRWPDLTRMIARYLGKEIRQYRVAVDALIVQAVQMPEECQLAILKGLNESLRGTRKVEMPKGWLEFSALPSLRTEEPLVRQLSTVFGSGRALDELRQIAMDQAVDLSNRGKALEAYIDAQPEDLRKLCETLLDVRVLNAVALRGLSRFDDNGVSNLIIRKYRAFQAEDRPLVLQVLLSRPTSAGLLLETLAKPNSPIPVKDITAFHARQIESLGDEKLSSQLREVWGELGETDAAIKQATAQWKERLTQSYLASADLPRGRLLFNKSCSNCHVLFGVGAKVGPELTGSQRGSLDYLLENILNPSAVVGKDFRMSVVRTIDGRVLNGLVVSRDDQKMILQTATELMTLAASDIEEIKVTGKSAMPDGLLQNLSEEEVRDLLAYLMSPVQVGLVGE